MPKKYKVVTDKGAFLVETDEPSEPDIASRQAASKAAFEANQPESHLGMNMSAGTLWDELKKGTGQFLNGPAEGQPGYSPSTGAANMLGMIAPGGPETEGMGFMQGMAHSPLVSQIRNIGNLVTSPDALLARATANRQPVPPSNDLLSAVSPKAGLVRALTKPYRAVAAPVQDALAHFLSNGMPVGPEIAADEASRLAQAAATNPLDERIPNFRFAENPESLQDMARQLSANSRNLTKPGVSPVSQSMLEALRSETITPEQQAGMEQAWANRGSEIGSPAIPPAAQATEPTIYKPAPDTGLPSITPPQTAPDLNKWMNVSVKQITHGADPGKQIIAEGLLGADKPSTLTNTQAALADAGQQLEARLQEAAGKGLTLDAQTPVYDALNAAMSKLNAPTDEAFTKHINTILDKIETRYPDLSKLSPLDAQKLKIELGDAIKWTSDDPVDKALIRIYGDLNQAIKDGVPGIARTQDRWASLYQGVKALKLSMLKDAIGRGTGAAFAGAK